MAVNKSFGGESAKKMENCFMMEALYTDFSRKAVVMCVDEMVRLNSRVMTSFMH